MNIMLNILSTIAIILILSASFTKLFEVILNDQTKNIIKDKVESFWVEFDDRHPHIIIQAPLIFLSTSYNIIFGKRCFSKMSLTRSALLSVALLIASLSITGVFTGTPFGMKDLPWDYFDTMIQLEKSLYDTELSKTKKNSDKEETSSVEHRKQRWAYISQFDKPIWRVSYSVFFIMFIFIINALVDTISFSISRLMLNEMIQIKSVLLLLSVFFLNAFISLFIATIVLFLSMLLCVPSIAGVVLIIVSKLLLDYPSWTSIGLFAAAVGAWNLTGGWLKVLAVTTIFPSIVFLLIVAISILISPIKTKVHTFIKYVILRAIEHEKGIFAFFSIFFTAIGVFIGTLVKLVGS